MIYRNVAVFIKPTRIIVEPLEHLVKLLSRLSVNAVYEDRAWQSLGCP